ncbi:MAG: hypothetical protein ABIT04_04360 [Novosphingobium sp.]
MRAIIHRLENGERWWAAEAAFAAAALTLLLLASSAARELSRLMQRATPHPAAQEEFAMAAVAVLCGWAGLACVARRSG